MHYLTLVLDGGEWSASHTSHFTPREKAPSSHWLGVWEGPRAVLGVGQREFLAPAEIQTPIIHPVVSCYTN